MKITRYPQSCLKIEDGGHALLIDVGTLATADYKIEDFGEFDAVLFTHRHSDHFDVDFLPKLAATGATLYGNSDTAQYAGGAHLEVIEDNEELVIADFKVKAFHMEHCLMVDGSPGVPNTAFLINDRLLLPGDSIESGEVQAEIVAAPIFGPDISFHDAYRLAKAVGATTMIPVHYDVVNLNAERYLHLGGDSFNADSTVHVLANGQSIQV